MRRRPSRERPPGSPGLPFIGCALDFRRQGLGYLVRMAREHGDVIWSRMFGTEIYLVSHPDGIKRILVDNRRAYAKDVGGRRSRRILGNALQSRNGAAWERQRQRLMPVFARNRMARFDRDVTAAAREAMAGWRDGEQIDLARWAMDLTLEISLRTHFGAPPGEAKESIRRAFDAGGGLLFSGQQRVFSPPLWFPSPKNRRYLRLMAELDDAVFGLIRHRRRTGERGHDLLSQLLDATDPDGETMGDQLIRDELLAMMLAGQQTMALALMHSLRLVADHPEVEARLVAEIEAALEDGRPPTATDLEHLPVTAQVVKETLRLSPPAGVLNRRVVEDDEIGGYRIPAGAMVFISQWVVHRDPRFYPDPEAFRPERWTPDFERALPELAFFPFGGGPRACIASAYSMMELRLLLASILQGATLELVKLHPDELEKARTDSGIQVRVRRR